MRVRAVSLSLAVAILGVVGYLAARWDVVGRFVPGGAPSDASAAPVAPPPAVPVKVAAALKEDVPIVINCIGTVQAYNAVNVKSRVDGEIVRLLFREGQDVRQGDTLAVIDPRPFQAQLDQQLAARAKDQALLDAALVDMRRYDRLVAQDSVSRQQADTQHALVDQYRAQVRNDDAQIEYARTQLDYATIRAPIGGRLGIRQIDQGNIVHSVDNTTIVTITQLQPISVVFSAAASAVEGSPLTLGQVNAPVTAVGQDDRTELDAGIVELVDTQVDQSTGTLKLKARFPNQSVKLWPGNFVNGRIQVDVRRGGVTVPAVALRHGPRGDFVWVVKNDGTVAVRNVTAGQAQGGRILIERNLTSGELVVTDGYYRLDNGSRVEFERPPAPAANRPATARD